MMQDVLIIRRNVEEFCHSEKRALMTIEKWKSIDEIARSTILTNRLQKYFLALIYPTQYGFIAGRNISHNVLNVQMAMDYARNSHQN